MFFKTDALVLKTNQGVNHDVFLTLFTKTAGKMDVVASHAKRPKSPLAACAKPAVHGNFVLNTRNSIPRVVSCDIYDSHFRMTDRLESLAYSSYFLEWCHLTVQPGISDEDHYRLILDLMDLLSENEVVYERLRAAYLIKLADLTGHMPNLDVSLTGQTVFYFSILSGGLIDRASAAPEEKLYKFNASYLQLIEYLRGKDMRMIARTEIHPKYLEHLVAIFEQFLMYHLEIKAIKSRAFLEDIKD
ncbi:MAG: repair protein RecO [Clostridiales bacterium]|jgi:DNA repair protein RecO (recombination protein O)|nr:repair protein RecO [Clostridiales bacterium]